MHLICTLFLTLAAAAPQATPLSVNGSADIGSAARDCAKAVSITGVKPVALLRSAWIEQFRSPENGTTTYTKTGMIITTAALPGVNMCAIRARTAGDDEFAAITRAVGKSLHARDAMKTYDKLAAKRTGEAYFDTKTHSVTLSARPVDGGPGIQISLLPKR
jgi:hypothetical protein